MTQAIAGNFEPFVRQYPEQWYVFRDIWPDNSSSSRTVPS